MFIKCKWVILIALVVFMVGCSLPGPTNLIPKQDLDPRLEKEITQAIKEVNHNKLRKFGKPATPLILERVFEIGDDRSLSRDVRVSADGCNLIIDLRYINDKRAIPALIYLLEKKKYRTFRPTVAWVLGRIGDEKAVVALWKVFEEEKGYLDKGDAEGPDMGWGLASDYTYQVLLEVGMSLRRLGEDVKEIPLSRGTRIRYEHYEEFDD